MTASDDELIISGDGLTPETSVKFRPCILSARIVRERRFVCEQMGKPEVDWTEALHFTSLDMQSVWVLELPDGTLKNLYFDTSETLYDHDA